MNRIICLILTLLSSGVSAAELPKFNQTHSPHKLFLSSETSPRNYDSWVIDSGYSYNLFEKVDLYVGTRLVENNDSGFLSGVRYQVSPRLTVKSSLHSYTDNDAPKGQESGIAAEVQSRVHLTESLDLHATLGYQEWQKGFEVGIGFRF